MRYDGTKLLSLKDRRGITPEIFMATDVRSSGKTTFFVKMETKRFLNKQEKFVYLVRHKNELDGLGEAMYKEVGNLFFSDKTFESKIRGGGLYCDLLCDGVKMGYGLPLNSYDKIKKKSHLFTDATSILFDEFQSETNHYLKDEVGALHSIHTSLARGSGRMVRYLPIYMLSNHITLLNPYFNLFGLTNLSKETRYYRGNGFVLEQQFNEDAINESKQSAFNIAFSETDYSNMSKQGVYLLDEEKYIVPFNKIKNKEYLMTLLYGGKEYGVYTSGDKMYCSTRSDHHYPLRYVIGKEIGSNSRLIASSPFTVKEMRDCVANGSFLFESQKAKECVFKALSY